MHSPYTLTTTSWLALSYWGSLPKVRYFGLLSTHRAVSTMYHEPSLFNMSLKMTVHLARKYPNRICNVNQPYPLCTVNYPYLLCIVNHSYLICTMQNPHLLCTVKHTYLLCNHQYLLCTINHLNQLYTMNHPYLLCIVKYIYMICTVNLSTMYSGGTLIFDLRLVPKTKIRSLSSDSHGSWC